MVVQRSAPGSRRGQLRVAVAVADAVRAIARERIRADAEREPLPEPPDPTTTTAEPVSGPAPHPGITSLDFARRWRQFKSPVPGFHVEWYAKLDDAAILRLLFLAPREHAKTSALGTFILKEFYRDPSLRFGMLSQTAPMAQAFMREIRGHLSTRAPFGPDWIGAPWNNHELTLRGMQTGKDVSLFALGTGGQVTGRRADVLIFDDLESRKTVGTPERRRATREWMAREVMPLLSASGRAVVAGTRKHFDDIYRHLLDQPDVWTPVLNATSALLPDGRPLWAERWPLSALLLRKRELDATDLRAWAQEYENRVLPDALQMFDPEHWPTWERLPLSLRLYQAWDFAISEKTRADWSVCVTVGVDARKNVYLVNVHRGHWSPHAIQQEMDNQFGMYRPEVVVIEEAGFQAPIVQDIIQKLRIPARAVKPIGDKVLRARYLETRCAAGGFYRPAAPVPWWGPYAEEFLEFPEGAHDDQVDATVHALNLAVPMSGWEAFFRKEMAAMTGVAPEAIDAEHIDALVSAVKVAISESECALCYDPLPEEPYALPGLIGLYCSERCAAVAANRPGYRTDEGAA